MKRFVIICLVVIATTVVVSSCGHTTCPAYSDVNTAQPELVA